MGGQRDQRVASSTSGTTWIEEWASPRVIWDLGKERIWVPFGNPSSKLLNRSEALIARSNTRPPNPLQSLLLPRVRSL
jgi:hypothetical protein